MEIINCKCVECTTSRVMDIDFKRDLQHLVLTLCRILFNNIQEKFSHIDSQSLSQEVYHEDLSCITDLHQIFKKAKYLQFKHNYNYSSNKIIFNYQWDLNDQELNLNHLIGISKYHYQSFIPFISKIDKWRRQFLDNSSILSNIEQFLPGFKYLYDFHWITVEDRLLEPGVLCLASDFGVFIVVIIKRYYNDFMSGSTRYFENDYNEYIDLVNNYKKYATEKHGNKLLTVIGATFSEDPNCLCPLEFVDEIDYSIARSVQIFSDSAFSIHQVPRQEPAKAYEFDTTRYGQSWVQQSELVQKVITQPLKMPLNPGKSAPSAPIVGIDWAYYNSKANEQNDFEEYNYFNNVNYNYYNNYNNFNNYDNYNNYNNFLR